MGNATFPKPLDRDIEELKKGAGSIGEIRMFSGSTPPDKWQFCDGSLVSRTTYADLFGVLGTAFGGGDGSTTFAIPDFKGRTPVGVGESSATGHTAHTLGQMDGEETHTLSVAELASHYHSFRNDLSRASGGGNDLVAAVWGGNSTGGVNSTGSNTAHNTMQPYTGINFIIYTGVDNAA